MYSGITFTVIAVVLLAMAVAVVLAIAIATATMVIVAFICKRVCAIKIISLTLLIQFE